MLEHFPTEAAVIHEFTGALRNVLDLDIPFSDARGFEAVKEGFRTFLASIAHLPVLLKYGTLSIRQFNRKIRDPHLATVFNNLVHFGGLDVPILTVLLPLAYAHRGMAGIPLRGWLSFARAIERRFHELGGSTRYRAKVEKLLITNSAVQGVVLADGEQLLAERVISAADGRFTQGLLPGVSEKDLEGYLQPEDLSDQPVQVNLGAAMDLSGINGPMTYILSQPFSAAGREHPRITMHNKYYDSEAAPQGHSAVTVFLDSEYGWWKRTAADPQAYEEEKRRCADEVIAAIDRYLPGFAQRVEVIDVSTPLTRERYTGNWMGAMQARKPSANMIRALMQGSPRYAVQGVQGLYVTGQWAESWGGITTAAQSGRKTIQAVCKQDGILFRAEKPA